MSMAAGVFSKDFHRETIHYPRRDAILFASSLDSSPTFSPENSAIADSIQQPLSQQNLDHITSTTKSAITMRPDDKFTLSIDTNLISQSRHHDSDSSLFNGLSNCTDTKLLVTSSTGFSPPVTDLPSTNSICLFMPSVPETQATNVATLNKPLCSLIHGSDYSYDMPGILRRRVDIQFGASKISFFSRTEIGKDYAADFIFRLALLSKDSFLAMKFLSFLMVLLSLDIFIHILTGFALKQKQQLLIWNTSHSLH